MRTNAVYTLQKTQAGDYRDFGNLGGSPELLAILLGFKSESPGGGGGDRERERETEREREREAGAPESAKWVIGFLGLPSLVS